MMSATCTIVVITFYLHQLLSALRLIIFFYGQMIMSLLKLNCLSLLRVSSTTPGLYLCINIIWHLNLSFSKLDFLMFSLRCQASSKAQICFETNKSWFFIQSYWMYFYWHWVCPSDPNNLCFFMGNSSRILAKVGGWRSWAPPLGC